MSPTEFDALDGSPVAEARRPWTFVWLVRRELMEHRAIWLAPAAVGALAVVTHLLSSLLVADADRAATLADPAQTRAFMALYSAATFAVLMTGLGVGALYCLSALQSERRDRSILFWKSLPVSDRDTVLSKAAVPFVILPLVVLAVVIVATTVMLGLQSLVWALDGADPRALWARLDLPFLWLCLAYGLPFMMLWYAPVFGWLLLVSAWARRGVLLWALAPLAAGLVVEHLALHRIAHWAIERWFARGVWEPFTVGGDRVRWIETLAHLDPLRVYSRPALWIGVVIAVLFIAAAVRLRRTRAPD